jgi:hypothetical protein
LGSHPKSFLFSKQIEPAGQSTIVLDILGQLTDVARRPFLYDGRGPPHGLARRRSR